MDLGNVLLWSVIAVICTAPFILMSRSAKKKKQASLKALRDFAAQHHASIDQEDHWLKFAIGVDEKQGSIFFLSELYGPQTTQWVKLSDIQKCRIEEKSRVVGVQGADHKVVDKLELVFSPRNKDQNTVVFELFNVESGNVTLTTEYQLADKWSKIANAYIEALATSK